MIKIFIITLAVVVSSCVTPTKDQAPIGETRPIYEKEHVERKCFLEHSSLRKYEDADLQYLDEGLYSVLYSNQHRQPYVVIYNMKYNPQKHVARRGQDFGNNFLINRKVRRSASDEHYRNSGFDRGHIAPSADFNLSPDAARSTFVFSNVSPQDPHFNRHGTWSQLENHLRQWSYQNSAMIQVIAGPVLNDKLPRLNEEKGAPSIPNKFYKFVLVEKNGECKGAGFKLTNKRSNKHFSKGMGDMRNLAKVARLPFEAALHHVAHDPSIGSSAKSERNRPRTQMLSSQNVGRQTSSTQKSETKKSESKREGKARRSNQSYVKKSRSGICHDRNSPHYERTKKYDRYNDIESCLKSGGRRPKR